MDYSVSQDCQLTDTQMAVFRQEAFDISEKKEILFLDCQLTDMEISFRITSLVAIKSLPLRVGNNRKVRLERTTMYNILFVFFKPYSTFIILVLAILYIYLFSLGR